MQYETALKAMTPEIYERMLSAVETGRWPDGQKLTDAQRENSMQLVMMYQKHYLDQKDHFQINKDGELVVKSKRDMRQELRDKVLAKAQSEELSIAKFNQSSKK
ncbi:MULTISPECIES: YeaC family protein [Gammaproteobacteria]|uniref:YeaC family protein n=1 Tax=Gammaproteobacteria TaxID=1236 RepID=UPI000DCFDB7B|nr:MULTISPECIES: DUF1315 family protein [Gammaproteobacteria]RTE87207.1 DUF1315 family protein [Aliidiomarina sp. B3213]TCZ93005.1 DUF1315 family protein [Lysobacter sp. N42]